jgi:hypothetical protein
MTTKWKCQSCDFCADSKTFLTAESPFDPLETIYGCPDCRMTNTIEVACDYSGCKEQSTCGTPSPDGYLRLCGRHYREISEKLAGLNT